MSKLILSYVCLLFMEVVATAQEKIVRLFPEGAPGETVPMVEKISKDGNRVAGEMSAIRRLLFISPRKNWPADQP